MTTNGASRPRVVVVGGGVTGLAAARRLALSQKVEVTLLERSERAGGVIATDRDEKGHVLELGPDCFISTKPWARELAVELGLEKELRSTSPTHRRSFILRDRKLIRIPEGFHLLAPTLFGPFARTPLISWRGKLRAGCELFLPAHPHDDEALESFVRRRLGGEVFERLVEPLVAGIYTADARELSLRATFPQFLDLERDHGSVIKGLWSKRHDEGQAAARAASGARYGLFLTLEGGLQGLVDRLETSLPPGTLRTRSPVKSVERTHKGFAVTIEGEGKIEAAGVIVALPAPAAGRVLERLDLELATLVGAIPAASAATVNVLLRRDQVAHPLDGMGFVVPSRERRFLLACSFSSTKFEGRAGPGEVLLRAFVGGATRRADAELAPDEIARRTLEELRELLGISGDPLRVLVRAWPDSMPQYVLGHVDRVARIEERARAIPGLALAGNAYHGVGIPDCVRSAEEACRTVLGSIANLP